MSIRCVRAPSRRARLIAGYTMLFIINGCFYTWSMLSLIFMETFPQWTVKQMALNGTLNVIASSIATLLVPKILTITSTKNAARLGGLLFCVGWVFIWLLRYNSSILLLYIGYSLAGYANGHLYSVIGQVLNAYYPDRSGAVSGGGLFVTGFGSLLMGAVEQILERAIGVFGLCLVFAGGFFLLVLFCSRWMVLPVGWAKDSNNTTATAEVDAVNVPVQIGIRTPCFWLLFIWSVLMASGGLLVVNNAANIFAYYQVPATFGMLVILFSGIGCQLMGFAIDRFGLIASLLGSAALSVVFCGLMLIGCGTGQVYAILIGVLLSGAGYGTTISAKMAGAVKLFGSRNLARYFAFFNLNIIPAAFMGPYISGQLQMLGFGYFPSFILILVLFGLSFFTALLGKKFRQSH